ncbi:interferon a3-like [Lampris incognitus]|uniref:interferon a3-like n=1 Tax=Lampris incognitus TaxID=2546036 RepID=UPI0024B63660|nr:interferon a3-like [Lampris incognitus]
MHSWIRLLFLLCGVTCLVRCCDWLQSYGLLSNRSLTQLEQMGGRMTEQECPVSFPYTLYTNMRRTKVETRLKFIKDSLELIIDLYHQGNLSSANWETSKTDIFLITLHRQKDGLTPCVSVSNRKSGPRLTRYYRKLANRTLREMSSSPGSWELIRKETRKHLEQLDLLFATVRRPTGSQ